MGKNWEWGTSHNHGHLKKGKEKKVMEWLGDQGDARKLTRRALNRRGKRKAFRGPEKAL